MVQRCVRESCPLDSPLFTDEVMLYLSVSLADFHLWCSRELTFPAPELMDCGEAAFTPHSWHRRSGSWDCQVRDSRFGSAAEHRDGRQDGYVVPGSRRQRTDRQSPISLKNLAETWGWTLGKGCGDESYHPIRAKGTGVTALPLWLHAGKILTLHLVVGMGQSLCENCFCGGISKVECEATCCCRSVGP